MGTDWNLISAYAAPVIALFIGIAIDRIVEQKSRIIAYFTHAEEFNLPAASPTTAPMTIRTHGIVIKNVGKRPAIDIRVRHNNNAFPPFFRVSPVVEHRQENLPGGGVEIVFPTLVPNEQVSIAYLYFPPLFYNQIHAGIRHSEGFATEVTALPTPQFPPWLRRALSFLLILGTIALIYLIVEGFFYGLKIFYFLKSNNLF
ncbi:MAG: hypothetical protein WC732_01835 [Candidatus Omnitrophota bacterium]